jgi:hypothetical protein
MTLGFVEYGLVELPPKERNEVYNLKQLVINGD